MKREVIADLEEHTSALREELRYNPHYVEPNVNDERVPKSVFEYQPVTWEADPGVWHTLLGRMPDEGIWTIGTSPLESMIEFDKELNERISEDGKFINDIDQQRLNELHKNAYAKIDAIIEGWLS